MIQISLDNTVSHYIILINKEHIQLLYFIILEILSILYYHHINYIISDLKVAMYNVLKSDYSYE